MKTENHILISRSIGETRTALVESGIPREIRLFRDHKPSFVGTVFLGRITTLSREMQAAFIDLGDGRTGFLPLKTLPKAPGKKPKDLTVLLHEGQRLIVQVMADAVPGKQMKLTARVELVCPTLVFHPHRSGAYVSSRIKDPDRREELKKFGRTWKLDDYGITFRTDAENITHEQLSKTATTLIDMWQNATSDIKNAKCPSMIAQFPDAVEQTLREFCTSDVKHIYADQPSEIARVSKWVATFAPHLKDRIIQHKEKQDLFSIFGVDDDIENILSKNTPLKSGAWITIEETEALTAIDVNMGNARFTNDHGKQIFAVNREAAREIFRQLRLRSMGGIVVIDFIDMADKGDIKSLQNFIDELIVTDPEPMQRGNISSFGLMELTRRSRHLSLNQMMLVPTAISKNLDTQCLDLLRETYSNAFAHPGRPVTININDDMQKWFENNRNLIHDFEQKTGSQLIMECS